MCVCVVEPQLPFLTCNDFLSSDFSLILVEGKSIRGLLPGLTGK